jgi:N-acetylneuraminic acid mutarotase
VSFGLRRRRRLPWLAIALSICLGSLALVVHSAQGMLAPSRDASLLGGPRPSPEIPRQDAFPPDLEEPRGRMGHTSVWTGTEMLIWGGYTRAGGQRLLYLDDGARYDPMNDHWTLISRDGAPSPRHDHVAVWTGSEMIVWGGNDPDGTFSASGGRYDPATDTWRPLPPSEIPQGLITKSAFWTGSEMIIWGNVARAGLTNAGARYDPIRNTWQPISNQAAPSPRYRNAAIWTGSEMIVWGGLGARDKVLSDGGRYHPNTDTWTPISPVRADLAIPISSAVWTGEEIIGWSGERGVRYDPVSDRWRIMSSETGVSARRDFKMIWTGREAIFWGGHLPGNRSPDHLFADGARYDPTTDQWTAIPTEAMPNPRFFHTLVWTGSELLVWGGMGKRDSLPPNVDRYAP